jgi:thymidine kinase
VLVGDTAEPGLEAAATDGPPVSYEVLCRRHHRQQLTRASAGAAVSDPLPFGRTETEEEP